MKRPAKRLFVACLASLLVGAGPTVTTAAEIGVATQDLVNVSASDLVTTATWSRLSDAYTLQVVFNQSRYAEKRRAIAAGLAAANPVAANSITSITRAEMERLGIVNVADGACGNPGMSRPVRGRYFIGNTIENLRGMDPAFGNRTLTLVEGRRVVAGQPPPPGTVNQSYPPAIKDGRVEVWLLKADGTQILPVAYSCVRQPPEVDVGIEYNFDIADSAQAVAAAIRIDDEYYIDLLQPLEPKAATP